MSINDDSNGYVVFKIYLRNHERNEQFDAKNENMLNI